MADGVKTGADQGGGPEQEGKRVVRRIVRHQPGTIRPLVHAPQAAPAPAEAPPPVPAGEQSPEKPPAAAPAGQPTPATPPPAPQPAPARKQSSLSMFIESTYDAVLVTDSAGIITQFNQRAGQFLRCDAGDLPGRPVGDVIPGADAAFISRLKETLEKHRYSLLDTHCACKDGTKFPAEIAVHRLNVNDKAGICFLIRDISVRRNTEDADLQFMANLATMVEIISDLALADSIPALCRQAASAAREKLGFRRFSTWLAEADNSALRGTFGLDPVGVARDESACVLPVPPGSSLARAIAGGAAEVCDVPLRSGGQTIPDNTVQVVGSLECRGVPFGVVAAEFLKGNELSDDYTIKTVRLLGVGIGHLAWRLRSAASGSGAASG